MIAKVRVTLEWENGTVRSEWEGAVSLKGRASGTYQLLVSVPVKYVPYDADGKIISRSARVELVSPHKRC